MTRSLLTPTPEGEIKSGLIANEQAGDRLFEVFVHPFTAGELVACGKAGILKINGKPAWAEVVDKFGNGDYAVRIHIKEKR